MAGREPLLDRSEVPFQVGEAVYNFCKGEYAQLFGQGLDADESRDGEDRCDDEQNDRENGKQFHGKGGNRRRGELEHS